jgi:hypothetical protein
MNANSNSPRHRMEKQPKPKSNFSNQHVMFEVKNMHRIIALEDRVNDYKLMQEEEIKRKVALTTSFGFLNSK